MWRGARVLEKGGGGEYTNHLESYGRDVGEKFFQGCGDWGGVRSRSRLGKKGSCSDAKIEVRGG